MGLREQLQILRANARILITGLVVSMAVAIALSLALPKTWESGVKLIVGNTIGANTPDYNAQLLAQRLSQSYALVATTGPVLEHVIAELGLDTTIKELEEDVSATAPRDLNIVEIRASWSDPETAAAIANAVAAELIRVTAVAGGRDDEILSFVDEQLRTTMDDINETRASIEELSNLASPTAAQQAELEDLRNRLVQLNATYASLLTYTSGSGANTLEIIEPARPDDEPASPRPLVNLIAAVIFGLLAGIGLVFVRAQLDDSLRTPEQVSSVLGLPTLASIARMPELAGRDPIYRLTMTVFPRSSAAESFRMLRTNLEFASVDHPIHLIGVTSALPGEGKTLVAANLAVAFAQAGHDTILVDADLRNPEVHKLFGLSNVTGLTSLLRSPDQSVDAALQDTIEPRLRLLASGPLPPNPAELLGSRAMAKIRESLRSSGSIVIFDTPPLQAVTDAAVLGTSLDGILLVTHSGRTGRGASRAAVDALLRVDAPVLGAILNLTTGQWIDAYGYYGAVDPRGGTGVTESPAGGVASGAYDRMMDRPARSTASVAEPPADR